MISIDTKLMRELVAAANTANTNITTAMELLTSISSHQDWACKEKDAINDYSTNNKNKIRQLHEHSQSFLQVISSVSEEFETTESGISSMFSSVESLLSGIMSIAANILPGHTGQSQPELGFGGQAPLPNGIIGTTHLPDGTIEFDAPGSKMDGFVIPDLGYTEGGLQGNSPVIDRIFDGFKDLPKLPDITPMETFSFKNLLQPLSLCSFKDINLE